MQSSGTHSALLHLLLWMYIFLHVNSYHSRLQLQTEIEQFTISSGSNYYHIYGTNCSLRIWAHPDQTWNILRRKQNVPILNIRRAVSVELLKRNRSRKNIFLTLVNSPVENGGNKFPIVVPTRTFVGLPNNFILPHPLHSKPLRRRRSSFLQEHSSYTLGLFSGIVTSSYTLYGTHTKLRKYHQHCPILCVALSLYISGQYSSFEYGQRPVVYERWSTWQEAEWMWYRTVQTKLEWQSVFVASLAWLVDHKYSAGQGKKYESATRKCLKLRVYARKWGD